MLKDHYISLCSFLQKILAAKNSRVIIIRDNDTISQTLIVDFRVHKYYFDALLPPILDCGNNLLKINRCNKDGFHVLLYQVINLLRLSDRVKSRVSCNQNVPV